MIDLIQGSSYAGSIDNIILLIGVLVGFWFLAAEGIFFWLIWKFRAKPGEKSQYLTGKEKHVKRWITIPHGLVLICDVFIIIGSVRVWYDVKQRLPEADSTIRVIGQQWAWTFQHPGPDNELDTADDIFTVDDLYVEVEKTYHFRLESRDVLHSFSVPDLPAQAGCDSRARDHRVVRADGHRRVRRPVRGDLRDRPRCDGRPDPYRGRERTCGVDLCGVRSNHSVKGEDRWQKRQSTSNTTRTTGTTTIMVRSGLMSSPVFSTDHKVIALQYMFTGMFMALIGGYMAYVFRMQLAFPGISVPGFGQVSPGEYNALVTNHGTIMIFWVAMPVLIAAFGNFLIPLMIGADDMVFPQHQPALVSRSSCCSAFCWGRSSSKEAASEAPGPRIHRSPEGRVQPDPAWCDPLASRRGAGVRGVPVGRYQLHHDRS